MRQWFGLGFLIVAFPGYLHLYFRSIVKYGQLHHVQCRRRASSNLPRDKRNSDMVFHIWPKVDCWDKETSCKLVSDAWTHCDHIISTRETDCHKWTHLSESNDSQIGYADIMRCFANLMQSTSESCVLEFWGLLLSYITEQEVTRRTNILTGP